MTNDENSSVTKPAEILSIRFMKNICLSCVYILADDDMDFGRIKPVCFKV
jgi:hypothetical protein